ncbi:hypothetical protein DBDeUG_0280 [Chlamydia pecorum]|nr:hypothetical protein DBDeUG_0280 [Chlamydia pecorum]
MKSAALQLLIILYLPDVILYLPDVPRKHNVVATSSRRKTKEHFNSTGFFLQWNYFQEFSRVFPWKKIITH